MERPAESERSNRIAVAGLAARLFWMGAGNFGLIVLAIFIGQNKPIPYYLTDLLFWAVVMLLLLARYLDIAHLQGTTVYSEPATMAHWRRYAMGLVVLAVVVWAGAHGVARFG
jgi:hypothetical protein